MCKRDQANQRNDDGARKRCEMRVRANGKIIRNGYILVMGVPHPWECTEGADHDGQIGYNSHNEDGIVGYIQVAEVVDDLIQKPDDTRERTAAMNTTQML
jgi:hypothetical protein